MASRCRECSVSISNPLILARRSEASSNACERSASSLRILSCKARRAASTALLLDAVEMVDELAEVMELNERLRALSPCSMESLSMLLEWSYILLMAIYQRRGIYLYTIYAIARRLYWLHSNCTARKPIPKPKWGRGVNGKVQLERVGYTYILRRRADGGRPATTTPLLAAL